MLLIENIKHLSMQTNFKTNYRTIVKAPIEKAWNALTNAEIVKQYFFGSDQVTDWKVGSPIYFRGEYEGKSYEDKGIVQEYVPNKKLSFSYLSSWNALEDKPENYLLVQYEVKEVPEGTELTITQSNYDEEKAKHSAENWKIVIDGLKKIVE
jgi:uncharacterized protein YndB with AHSA1/START domain